MVGNAIQQRKDSTKKHAYMKGQKRKEDKKDKRLY